MARGGSREGAGRKPGSVTVRSRAIANGLLDDGQSPLEFMLQIMRNPAAKEEDRMDMAKAAAPFCHAKLSSVEASGPGGGPLEIEAGVTVTFRQSDG